MLTPDVRFEGWTTETWTRFVHLWKPRATPDREATRPRGGVIAIHEDGRLRKLLHTRTGRLDPRGEWPIPLSELASIHHASFALAAKTGALEELMERFGARLRRTDDLTAQALLVAEIAREMLDEGAIERWPERLKGVPLPTDVMVRRALDAICPDGHAMVLGVFRQGDLWTAGAARRRGDAFDVLAGPEDIRIRMGLISGDWRRDYRHVARAVEEQYAPVAMGIFAEVDRFRELQVDPQPGAWGRAAVVRDVILSPMPVGVRLALGADGARFAFETFRTIAGRSETLKKLDPVFAAARERLGAVAGNKDVSTTLGFDPLAALRALLRR
ncbi:MAG: hypothetical protein KIT84_05650 [Labilithrix sp.]|nr:hypothetical protein [Labilithrix sp.]MCW5810473.1 hypothetical protein [Labilithrix sp.]